MTRIAEIEGLLDAVHAALLTADTAALRHLTPALETALTDLEDQVAPADPGARRDLERLRRKAGRSAACALAAGRGIRAATRRLEDIRAAASGLATYDSTGHRCECPGAAGMTRRF